MWDIDFAGQCMEKLQDEYNKKRDEYLAFIHELEAKGWTKKTISIKPEVLVFVDTSEESKGEVYCFFDGKEDLFPWEVMLIKTDIFKAEEDIKKVIEDYEKVQKKEAKLRKWASVIINVIVSLIPGVGWIISVVLGAIQAVYEYRIASAKTKDMKRALEIQRDEEMAAIKKLEAQYKSGQMTEEEKIALGSKMKEVITDKQKMEEGWMGKILVVAGAAALIL